MKSNRISLQVAVAVCALPLIAFCPSLSADQHEAMFGTGAEQIVTLNLTETYTEAALKPRDEDGKIFNDDLVYFNEWYTEKLNSNGYVVEENENSEFGSKQVTVKISNKELFEALVEEGTISGPISGWALRFVTSASGEYADSSNGRFYAVKKNMEPVDLSEIISTDGDDGHAYADMDKWSRKTTYKYTPDDEIVTEKETWSYSSRMMTNLEIEFSFSDSFLHLDGIFSEAWSVKSFGAGEDQYWQFAPGAAKFDNGSGTVHFEEYDGEEWVEWEDPSVIKGTINFSAGKLFPDITEQYPDFELDYDDFEDFE